MDFYYPLDWTSHRKHETKFLDLHFLKLAEDLTISPLC